MESSLPFWEVAFGVGQETTFAIVGIPKFSHLPRVQLSCLSASSKSFHHGRRSEETLEEGVREEDIHEGSPEGVLRNYSPFHAGDFLPRLRADGTPWNCRYR